MSEREQQKVFLTPDARQKLRLLAERWECDLSDVVETLVVAAFKKNFDK